MTKLVSWNVNGIRACLRKGFLDFAKQADADLICLQETRAEPDQVDLELPGYEAHWYPAEKKGYSGTMILTRIEPLAVARGMGQPAHDAEGRLLAMEFPDYTLVNVYTPNSGNGLVRLDYRTKEWEPAMLAHLKQLEARKPVVLCGDLNVAHKEIDLARPKQNVKNAGFTPEERACMDELIGSGFVDTFREFTTEGGHYSWWSQRAGARDRNIGWRIDYFLCSPALRDRLASSHILPHVLGSDHAPLVLELKD